MLQPGEVVIIAIIALIVLGPHRLPEIARKLGEWTRELRNAAREITAGLEAEVKDLKTVGQELKSPLEDVKKPFTEIRDEVGEIGGKRYQWKGPKPVSGPTPEDAMRDLEAMEAEREPDAAPSDPEE
ncbi:MAG TPA: twin-arginine translocase TatA/TatE family subunit [Acidimicrobiia bacterium]|jgi:sec-independent protein translocase protein TatB|nr:twin-arginine translocase TatA/TatE family subunit [Acidimicrobiia bacterium]